MRSWPWARTRSRDAMVMLMMRSKLVVEGAGAVGAAGVDDRPRPCPRQLRDDGGRALEGHVDTGLLGPSHPAAHGQCRAPGRLLRPRPRLPGKLGSLAHLHRAKRCQPRHRRPPARRATTSRCERRRPISCSTRNREHAKACSRCCQGGGLRRLSRQPVRQLRRSGGEARQQRAV